MDIPSTNNNSSKSVHLVFYGDFGLRRGKGEEVLATTEALFQAGLLGKVYVRDRGTAPGTKFDKYVISSIPGGNILPRALSGVKKFILSSFPSRIWGERLFIFFTSLRLTKEDKIVYMTAGSPKTLRKAKKLGKVVGFHCGVLHPTYNLKIIKEEFTKFNLRFKNKTLLKELKNQKRNLTLFDFIVVHSDFAKENYIQYGIPSEKIFLNPLGIDLEKFRPNPKGRLKKEKIFLFIGGLFLLKGAHYLLEAWKQLNLKDAKLIVCGNKEPDDWPLIKKYLSLSNVEYPGFVDPLEYYHKASVFVFPSLTEGFPRVIGEAMASGLPVITTPPAAQCVRNSIDGFVVPIRNVQVLKEKILYFCNNPDRAIEMGKNARQRAEKFTWERYMERFIKIIKRVCQN